MIDQEAFHIQWCKRTSDVVCGHEKFNKGDSGCLTCGEWYIEDESEWLQCPICEQWFHATYFQRLNLIFNLVSDGNNIFFL